MKIVFTEILSSIPHLTGYLKSFISTVLYVHILFCFQDLKHKDYIEEI